MIMRAAVLAALLTLSVVVALAQDLSGPGGGGAAVPTMASTGFSSFTDPQGSASLSNAATGVLLKAPNESGNVGRLVCKNAPATPYSAIAKLLVSPGGVTSDDWAGLTWRTAGASGVEPFIMYGLVGVPYGTPGIYGNNYTNYNTYAGSASMGAAQAWYEHTVWVKLKDDGTNVTAYHGADGVTWQTSFTSTKTAGFLGTTGYNMICLFTNAKEDDTSVTLQSYQETSP